MSRSIIVILLFIFLLPFPSHGQDIEDLELFDSLDEEVSREDEITEEAVTDGLEKFGESGDLDILSELENEEIEEVPVGEEDEIIVLDDDEKGKGKELELFDPSETGDLTETPEVGPKEMAELEDDFEEIDDLDSLKEDVGEMAFEKESSPGPLRKKRRGKNQKESTFDSLVKGDDSVTILIDDEEGGSQLAKGSDSGMEIFDVGVEEKELLELSKFVEGKIPEKEWDEISASSQLDKYVVQKGDWLWKISRRLFGSGFYYSKIWALNPQILNPHEIEPGMTLIFSTGDTESMPEVSLGDFDSPTDKEQRLAEAKKSDFVDLEEFGENIRPPWLEQRKKLIENGAYFQFASDETYDDLKSVAAQNLKKDYTDYTPPSSDIVIQEPGDQYDDFGFDKDSKIIFDVKEGFFLNTFVTSNIVQDLGFIEGMGKENIFLSQFDRVYVKFDRSVKVRPGDMFSVYIPGGEVTHRVSDRSGYRYTIGGQVQVRKKINGLWECELTEVSGLLQRGDRITVHTPKIGKIVKTFNKKSIEAAIIDSYDSSAGGNAFGSVVYLDRGRADGVEMGTVFESYSFMDRGTQKRLTSDPTYKTGELTVISLTDNFSTALITESRLDIPLGSLVLTKTEEQVAAQRDRRREDLLSDLNERESQSLDELDVELDLDDISDDLLEKAEQVQLTEDELAELERQEREKSVIQDHERDLKELERLEAEVLEAEDSLNEAKVDEDKFLEVQDLNNIERESKGDDPDAFESLNDIEGEVGLKYLDEDLNSKENPYGLTEFDLEEVDELLNTDEL